ncbi:ras di-ras and rheb family members of small gtpase superfamily [Anaeramoeba ignava]|uniref:Ras di-ras and rheb family members of small gtpase superfamily n=1 Tax=Anaeramoeba ignava TaxID=1746090 RepID=A0A9Q0LL01_ANAIG|nr:ras di-ras and rheb family members of small gtpase superfamily [Anaeramoeba ignava]
MNNPLLIPIIGPKEVGKSTFTTQFIFSQFIEEYDPTIESYRKQIEIDNEILIVELYDFYQNDYLIYGFTKEVYKQSHGFVLIYSIIDRNSFNRLQDYLKEIYLIKNSDDFPIIIVGNKNDVENLRQVKKEEGEEFAFKNGCPFFEISTKARYNIDETIITLLREIRKYPFDSKSNSNSKIKFKFKFKIKFKIKFKF